MDWGGRGRGMGSWRKGLKSGGGGRGGENDAQSIMVEQKRHRSSFGNMVRKLDKWISASASAISARSNTSLNIYKKQQQITSTTKLYNRPLLPLTTPHNLIQRSSRHKHHPLHLSLPLPHQHLHRPLEINTIPTIRIRQCLLRPPLLKPHAHQPLHRYVDGVSDLGARGDGEQRERGVVR